MVQGTKAVNPGDEQDHGYESLYGVLQRLAEVSREAHRLLRDGESHQAKARECNARRRLRLGEHVNDEV